MKMLWQFSSQSSPESFVFLRAGPSHFPKVRSLTLSYAYHCCQFMPSTYENLLPDYTDISDLQEIVFFPGDRNFSTSWHENSSTIWSPVGTNGSGLADPWANLGLEFSPEIYDTSMMFSTPPPGIECSPTPGTTILFIRKVYQIEYPDQLQASSCTMGNKCTSARRLTELFLTMNRPYSS